MPIGPIARGRAIVLRAYDEHEVKVDTAAEVSLISRKLVQKLGLKPTPRSEEHTSELQSLMRISYAVFCLKKKKKSNITQEHRNIQLTLSTHIEPQPHTH